MRNLAMMLVLGFVIAVLFCSPGPAVAESDVAVGGGNAQVSLDFQIQIPTILYLRVGSAGGTVDTVTFNVTDFPGSGEVAGTSSGAYPVPVELRAIVATGETITLRADSSGGLTGGLTTIPFNEIRWDATAPFTTDRFDTSNNQPLEQFTDSGSRTGTYAFYYDNDTEYPTGTYTGTVTYTLSSP